MATKKTNAQLEAELAALKAQISEQEAATEEADVDYDDASEDDYYGDEDTDLEDDDLDEEDDDFEVDEDDGVVVRMPSQNTKLGISPVRIERTSSDPASLPENERVEIFSIGREKFYAPAEPSTGVWMQYLGQKADGEEGMAEVVLLREVLGVRGWRALCRQDDKVIKAVTNRIMLLFPDSAKVQATRPNRAKRRSSGRGRSRR